MSVLLITLPVIDCISSVIPDDDDGDYDNANIPSRTRTGYNVPFTPNCGAYPTSGWCFHNISNKSRGQFSNMWEMAAGIYGHAANYSRQVTESRGYRPEGARSPIINNGAHVGDGPPGHGTLVFYGMTPAVQIG